jgi:flagellar biosynthesis protein FliQ
MADLVALLQEALLLSVTLSLPLIGVAALATFLAAVFQAVTQVHDGTLAHLPRLVAISLALVVVGPRIGSEILAFATRVFSGG